jgi:hydroxylaminobenzene mutase
MTIHTGGRRVLIHGLTLILAGLLWGFAPPMTPYPRLALGAHIQFEINGLLFMAVGILLLTVPSRVGRKALWVMVVSAWLTWLMALSEVANSWWGTTKCYPSPQSRPERRAHYPGKN